MTRTVNVHTVMTKSTSYWAREARRTSNRSRGLRLRAQRGYARQARRLAALSEHLGVPVGIVVRTRQEEVVTDGA